MPLPPPARRNRRLELWLLLALVFFLPLYEAPKNFFWLAYVAAWLFNRRREGDWGGRWDRWDTLIAAWIASGYVVALFAATRSSEWNGATDVLRYGAILWCVRRGGYTAGELTRLGGVVLLGCAVALAWGFWRYYVTHERAYVELHSVGHVNHSAPYLAICAGLALSWLFACWQRWRNAQRAVMVVALAFIFAGLVVGSSRGAVGAMGVAVVLLAAAWWRRSRRPAAAVAVALAVGVIAGVYGDIGVVEKQRAGMKAGDHLSHRETIWNRAVVAWQAHPWFGVGIDNFGAIDDDMLRKYVESRGKPFVREEYLGTNHAHNLYLNTLAERGIVGFAAFALVLVAWARRIWRCRPDPAAADLEWTFWGANLCAWTVLTGAGIFNTTLHHEIAMLAMLLLGGWMALDRRR